MHQIFVFVYVCKERKKEGEEDKKGWRTESVKSGKTGYERRAHKIMVADKSATFTTSPLPFFLSAILPPKHLKEKGRKSGAGRVRRSREKEEGRRGRGECQVKVRRGTASP
jgi:hypothetical protein